MPEPFEPPPKSPSDDDRIVAQALRRSLLTLLLLGLAAGSLIFWFTRNPARPGNALTPLQAPVPAAASIATPPKTPFQDITLEAGISFQHVNGARGEKLLPETMGGGVAFLDFDGDGDPDLLFVNSMRWPDLTESPGQRKSQPSAVSLFENDGKGHFHDITPGSGLEAPLYGMGVACGDFDNDGRVDIFITGVGENRLFQNLGSGKFRDVTAGSGILGASLDWSTAAAWLDIDNDGDLDLFVANYIAWTPELDREVNNQLVGLGRAYGRPWNFPGSFPHLYRNEGHGRFTDISALSGLQIKNPATRLPMSKSMAVAPIDLNADGWMDIVIANDTVQNFVFTNCHNGTFQEIGAQSGIAFDAYGQTRGAMGIDAARFRNDASLGIAIGNFANEMNALYVSQGDHLLFADEAITSGIGPASQQLLKFGLFFFDYDLDGRLDVLTTNGHIEESIEKVQKNVRYRQPAQLFWNSGISATFVPVNESLTGTDLFQPIVGRGSAYADIDGDGDLDVVMTQIAGRPLLLRNNQQLGHHWLRLRLEGKSSNRDAIGAWVTVTAGSNTFSRQVMPTKSYLSQSELTVTFGLGLATRIDAIQIRWPQGTVQTVDPLPLDRLHRIQEP